MASNRKKIFAFAFTVLSLIASSGLVVRVVHAAPTAAERETARRLMDEGKARMKANEPARAVESFQKANDIVHVPTTGLALAKAHLAAGHLIEAREAALDVGRMPREPNEPAVLETARKHAKEMTESLKNKIPTLKLKIKNGPAAKVLVDDVEIAASIVGEPVAVNPGKRIVVVRNAEGAEAKADVEVAEKEVKEVELTVPSHGDMPRAATVPSSSTTTAPMTTTTTTSPPPKKEVKGFGNDDFDLRGPSQRTPLAEGLIYGGLGVGVIGLGVGLVTGAMTLSKASAVEPQCENNICAPAAQGELDSARTLATVSTISIIVGVVGAGVGVFGFALPKRDAGGGRTTSPKRGGLTILPAGIGGTF